MLQAQPRVLRTEEKAVIRAALERARRRNAGLEMLEGIDAVEVVGGCNCGCASIILDIAVEKSRPQAVAEAKGTTLAGGAIGVTVWAIDKSLAALEVYDLGAGVDDLKLPVPESLEPAPDRPVVYVPTVALVAMLAVLFGVQAIAIAWVGHWVMEGYWPGPWRYYTATALGGGAALWGLSRLRRRRSHRVVPVAVHPGQALLVVAGLVLGTLVSLWFFNW